MTERYDVNTSSHQQYNTASDQLISQQVINQSDSASGLELGNQRQSQSSQKPNRHDRPDDGAAQDARSVSASSTKQKWMQELIRLKNEIIELR